MSKNRVTIFSSDNIDITSRIHLCVAITFDYLIIHGLTLGYDYYPGIVMSHDRIKLHCLKAKLLKKNNKYNK